MENLLHVGQGMLHLKAKITNPQNENEMKLRKFQFSFSSVAKIKGKSLVTRVSNEEY